MGGMYINKQAKLCIVFNVICQNISVVNKPPQMTLTLFFLKGFSKTLFKEPHKPNFIY